MDGFEFRYDREEAADVVRSHPLEAGAVLYKHSSNHTFQGFPLDERGGGVRRVVRHKVPNSFGDVRYTESRSKLSLSLQRVPI